MLKQRLILLLVAAAFVTGPRLASAQMSLNILNQNVVALPGSTVVFTGTFTNTSLTDTFTITGSQVNNPFFTPSSVHLDITGASSNPDFMVQNGSTVHYAPGDTFTGPIFSLQLGANAALGVYTLVNNIPAFQYQGQNLTAGGTYFTNGPTTMSITVIPEPTTISLLAVSGVVGLLALRPRRSR